MIEQPRPTARRSRIAIAAMVVGGLLGGSALAIDAASASKEKTQSWLYVIDAGSARVEGARLSLASVDPIAVGFSDRPGRTVARFTVAELIATWDDLGFAKDPPNAAVSWFDGETEHTIVVELSEPKQGPDGLSFAYRELTRTPKRLRSRTAKPQEDLPAQFDDAILFIDHAFPTSVNSQVTD